MVLHELTHWFLHATGADNVSGPQYGFWSGFGSDLGEFAILVTLWKRLNCHVDGCWRIAIHHVPGTPYTTCRKHHPTIGSSVTADHVREAHHKANEGGDL